MKNQEWEQYAYCQHEKMVRMEEENDKLRKRMFLLRQGKNRMSEQVIHLSSKLYEMERNQPQDRSLSHVSAVSAEEDEIDKI